MGIDKSKYLAFAVLKTFSVVLLGIVHELRAQEVTTVPRVQADPSNLLGPVATSMAGATVSSRLGSDSVFQNPASAAGLNEYLVSGFFLGSAGALGLSVVDSKSGPVGGSVHFVAREIIIDEPNPAVGAYTRNELRAGAGLFGRMSDIISVGGQVKFAQQENVEQNMQLDERNWNLDLGLIAQFQDFSLGLLNQNMLRDTSGLNPAKLSAGAEFRANTQLSLSASVFRAHREATGFVVPAGTTSTGWAAGSQFALNNNLKFRAGYTDNAPWLQNAWTLGLGYGESGYTLDYSYRALNSSNGNTRITNEHSFNISVQL